MIPPEDCDITYSSSQEDVYEKEITDFIKASKQTGEFLINFNGGYFDGDTAIPIDLDYFTSTEFTSKFSSLKFLIYDEYDYSFVEVRFNSDKDYSALDIICDDQYGENHYSFICQTTNPDNINLKIGSIVIYDPLVFKNNNAEVTTATLNIKKIANMKWENLLNVAQLILSGPNNFNIQSVKDFAITLTVKSDCLVFASTTQSLQVKTDTKATFSFEFTSGTSTKRDFTLNIEGQLDYSKYPILKLKGFQSFTQTGTFSTIPESQFIYFEGSSIKTFSSESNQLPISFKVSSLPIITLSHDITFLYDVILGFSSLILDCTDSIPHKVTITNAFKGDIKIMKPNINIKIGTYQWTSSTSFPIASFDVDSISLVEVDTIETTSSSVPAKAEVISLITTYLDDSALENKKFAEGKPFFKVNSFDLDISGTSISILVNEMSDAAKIIHGFNDIDNCLSIYSKIDGNINYYGIKSRPVSSITRHIGYKCTDNVAMTTDTATDLNNLVGTGLLPPAHNLLYLYICEDLPGDFDLSALDASVTALQLTVEARTYSSNGYTCDLKFTANQANIASLTLIKTKFAKAQTLETNLITFDTVKFASKDFVITFRDTSLVTMDSDTIYLMSTDQVFNNLTIISDPYKVSSYKETSITLFKTSYQLLYPDQTPYDLSYDKVNYLTVKSNNGEEFLVTFDASLKTEASTLKQFTIQVSKDTKMFVKGDAKQVTFPDKVIVDHGDAKLVVSYSRPDQSRHFHSIGAGTVSEVLDYENQYLLCAYSTSSTKCSSEAKENVMMTELSTKLTSLITNEDVFNIKLTVADSSAADKLALSLDLLNSILITIEPCDSAEIAYVTLEQTTGITEIYSSAAVFNKVNIGSSSETISFGELRFNDCEFDANLKNVELKADDIFCQYLELCNFKNISISDNLVLTGAIPTDEAKKADIFFQPDENANDVTAEITGVSELNVAINPSTLKLGAITFHIFRSRNYDALFNLIDNEGGPGIALDITCEENINISQMPMFTIDGAKAKSGKMKLAFTGQWEDRYNEDVVQVINIASIVLEISDIVPFRADFSNSIEIKSTAKDSGVTGPLVLTKYNQYSQPSAIIASTSFTTDRTTIYIMKGVIVKESGQSDTNMFQFQQSTITLKVDSVTYEKAENTIKIPITHSMDVNGISSIEISSLGNNVLANQTININSNIPATYDEETMKITKNDWTLIALPQDVMDKTEIKYTYKLGEDKPHGFTNTGDVMKTKIEAIGSLSHFRIYAAKLPSEIPFIFVYGSGNTDIAEKLITNAKEMKDAHTYIPAKIDEVIFYLNKGMEDDMLLDLTTFQDKTPLVTIRSAKTRLVTLNYPSNKLMNLTIMGGNIKYGMPAVSRGLKANPVIGIDVLTLSDCNFQKSGYSLSSENINTLNTDVDSLNQLIKNEIMTSFEEAINIDTANVINFTRNGWSLIESEIRDQGAEINAQAFTNVHFKASNQVSLLLEDGVTSIYPINLELSLDGQDKYRISIASGWSGVTDTKGWKLDTKSERVNLVLPFYPPPDIFPQGTDFDVTFNKPVEDPSAVVDVFIKSDYNYHESHTFDFTELATEFQRVRAPSISFSGKNTKLNFKDDKGLLEITNSVVNNNTDVEIGSTQVRGNLKLVESAVINGKISFTAESAIYMNWTMSNNPLISITAQDLTTVPTKIEVYFSNATAIDHEEFNDKYYRWNYEIISGKFPCSTYLDKLQFFSENPFFNGGSDLNIMDKLCTGSGSNQRLIIRPNKLLPIPHTSPPTQPPVSEQPASLKPDEDADADKGKEKNPMTTGAISGITIACVVVVAIIVGFVVYLITKKRFENIISTMPIDEAENSISQFSTQQEQAENTEDF